MTHSDVFVLCFLTSLTSFPLLVGQPFRVGLGTPAGESARWKIILEYLLLESCFVEMLKSRFKSPGS